MFNPNFTITHKLLQNVKTITQLVSDLNHKKFPKTVLFELETSSRVISAYSSTSIEGNPLSLTEVKKLFKSHPAQLRQSELEVVNYNIALERLTAVLKTHKTLALSTILQIHTLVMQGLLAKSSLGHLRSQPVFVLDPKTGEAVYLPPNHEDVAKLMNELVYFVKKNSGDIDPIIMAGLFHKQFVAIHPFVDGNGRVSRLCTKFLLANMGVDTFNLFSFENYYNRNVSRYFEFVGLKGNYYDIGSRIDFTAWLEYFTEGIIDELQRVGKELELYYHQSPNSALKLHEQAIIDYISDHGYIQDSSYKKVISRAKATRALDFKGLIDRGLISRKNKGKATFYILEK